jgi:hypothetical protein
MSRLWKEEVVAFAVAREKNAPALLCFRDTTAIRTAAGGKLRVAVGANIAQIGRPVIEPIPVRMVKN